MQVPRISPHLVGLDRAQHLYRYKPSPVDYEVGGRYTSLWET